MILLIDLNIKSAKYLYENVALPVFDKTKVVGNEQPVSNENNVLDEQELYQS